jgi:predicted small secreted protein
LKNSGIQFIIIFYDFFGGTTMEHLLKKLTLGFVTIGIGVSMLTACSHTFEGMGQDMQAMGKQMNSSDNKPVYHRKKPTQDTTMTTTSATTQPTEESAPTNMSGFPTTLAPETKTTETTTTTTTPAPATSQ